jgi:hypothetical protein
MLSAGGVNIGKFMSGDTSKTKDKDQKTDSHLFLQTAPAFKNITLPIAIRTSPQSLYHFTLADLFLPQTHEATSSNWFFIPPSLTSQIFHHAYPLRT